MINVKCTFCKNDNCGRITDLTIDGVSSHISGLDAIEAEYFFNGVRWCLDSGKIPHKIVCIDEPCNEMCGDDEDDEDDDI
jgi:hypothetical protein